MHIRLLFVIGFIAIACSSNKTSGNADSLTVKHSYDTLSSIPQSQDSIKLIEEGFDYEKAMQIESYLVKKSDRDGTTVITSKCAVYVSPDIETLSAMRKEYGDDYFTIADDANWYMSESSRTLDSLGVKQENIQTRYVQCLINGSQYTIDLNAETGLYWKLFFFNPNKKPRVMSMVGLWPDTVRAYFDLPAKP
jgi:hypothetical protein